MSVQRWRESEVMIADNEHGWWVKYDDHVAAIDHLERIHRNEINELRWFNQVTREDSFTAGFAEAVRECLSIAKNEDFLYEDGSYVWAAPALASVINKIGALDAYSHYGK